MFFPNLPSARLCASFTFIVTCVSGCGPANPPETSAEVAARSVQTGALSDDGSHGVIGSLYHGGSFWRLNDNERLFNWNHAADQQSDIAVSDLSPDGRWAVTVDTASTLVLWNTQTGEAERYWRAPAKALSVSVDADAKHALLGLSTGEAVLFDIRRGGIITSLKHSAPINSVALGSNGQIAVTGSEDNTAKAWNLSTGETTAQLSHGDSVQLVALSADNSIALSVSRYDTALVWRPHNGELVGSIPLQAEQLKRGLRFTAARFSDDNRRLLTGRPDGVIELWDVPSLRKIQQWHLPKRNAWQPSGAAGIDVAFVENGRIRVIASNGFIHTFTIKKPASTE